MPEVSKRTFEEADVADGHQLAAVRLFVFVHRGPKPRLNVLH